jgi:hypothetical protein
MRARWHGWWLPTSLLKIPHCHCLHYCVGDGIMPARSNSSSRLDLSAIHPGVKSVVWRDWRNTPGKPGCPEEAWPPYCIVVGHPSLDPWTLRFHGTGRQSDDHIHCAWSPKNKCRFRRNLLKRKRFEKTVSTKSNERILHQLLSNFKLKKVKKVVSALTSREP